MAQQEAALRKRQQIAQSNRTMFIWVAVASAVIGFALVVSWFLVQQIMFRQKVVGNKITTVTRLHDNNAAVADLQRNIGVVESTNEALALENVKASPSEKSLQVVLDALPAENNRLALGSSLQEKLVGGQPNVTLESLNTVDATAISSKSPVSGVEVMPFSMTATSSNPNSLHDLLKRLENSVRTITIDSLKIEQSTSKTSPAIGAHAFYLPEKTIELKKIIVKPDGAK